MHNNLQCVVTSMHNFNNITVHLGQYLSNKVAPLLYIYNLNTKAVSTTINMSDTL